MKILKFTVGGLTSEMLKSPKEVVESQNSIKNIVLTSKKGGYHVQQSV